MQRRLVWFPDGSPAGAVALGLRDGFEARPLSQADSVERRADEPQAVVVDLDRDATADVEARVAKLGGAPVVALVGTDATPDGWPGPCHAYLTKPVPPFALARALDSAFERASLLREAEQTKRQLEELNQIGVRLSAERDTDALLTMILSKAREVTHSDAGSVYLVEEERGRRQLRFKLTQNDFVSVPFLEFTIPISAESVAGYVAQSGEVLHLADAYEPPLGAPYRINRSFDRQVGYRTKSMLVVPMRTPAGETIGVLQLINCKRHGNRRFDSVEAIDRDAIPFPERFMSLAASLGSQAAVALQNSRLLASIQTLFEGFVGAAVTAIESRDPTTSGHSFRVADLTVSLAQAADRADHDPFKAVRFSPDEMREIRYASLLHDFGKVGESEEVLVKAKKLVPQHLEAITQRVELIRRGVELRVLGKKLDLALRGGAALPTDELARCDAELAGLLRELDAHLAAVVAANEPTVMPHDVATHIQHLPLAAFVDHHGRSLTVITEEEARTLSIQRGSLTPEEFKQIQSHVVHTYQFLTRIPWTRELGNIPEIARSHHEKLNGSGYPEGFAGDRIPIQSRMMTITDIFDALTARDRPYKAAVPVDRALDILGFERKAGAIDSALFDLFLAAKPWEHLNKV